MSRGVSDGQPSAASRPARILVVGNDYFIALELERSLTDAGFEVVGVAGTAEEALELALSKTPNWRSRTFAFPAIATGSTPRSKFPLG